ncbi:hypothetical protein MCOR25_008440 [Pyricularia grisea]|nr:hypothetical protein MCOR25_008440 [Pyricularia grisea]
MQHLDDQSDGLLHDLIQDRELKAALASKKTIASLPQELVAEIVSYLTHDATHGASILCNKRTLQYRDHVEHRSRMYTLCLTSKPFLAAARRQLYKTAVFAADNEPTTEGIDEKPGQKSMVLFFRTLLENPCLRPLVQSVFSGCDLTARAFGRENVNGDKVFDFWVEKSLDMRIASRQDHRILSTLNLTTPENDFQMPSTYPCPLQKVRALAVGWNWFRGPLPSSIKKLDVTDTTMQARDIQQIASCTHVEELGLILVRMSNFPAGAGHDLINNNLAPLAATLRSLEIDLCFNLKPRTERTALGAPRRVHCLGNFQQLTRLAITARALFGPSFLLEPDDFPGFLPRSLEHLDIRNFKESVRRRDGVNQWLHDLLVSVAEASGNQLPHLESVEIEAAQLSRRSLVFVRLNRLRRNFNRNSVRMTTY